MDKQTTLHDGISQSKFLLTWYGITDLRSALGLDPGGGPVLGALKNGEFTEVMILAYTDPSKIGPESDDDQRKWNRWLGSSPIERELLDRPREFKLVDTFSNTPAAHQLYKKWLRSKLSELSVSANVRLCVKELAALNDSKGIYDAVVQAMDLVLSDPGEKRITFFLSPGTPVMAFTWAFVALASPEIDIQILSSSDPRKPPVPVSLPYDLMAPSNRRVRAAAEGDLREFDVVFHLFGEQRMAPLLGVLQFPAKRHVFVTSDQHSSEIMQQFMPPGAWSELRVSPFDPMSAKVQILKEVAGLPQQSRVGFNLTGGTKLMFAGAIAACRKIGGVPFYFETREHSLIFLHDFKSMPVRAIENLELFFQANGFAIARKGVWQDNPLRQQRSDLTRKLWKERKVIAKTYRQLSDYVQDEVPRPFLIQQKYWDRNVEAVIEIGLEQSGRAHVSLCGKTYSFDQCPDFARYLAGGWLEEYVYLTLEPLLHCGVIRDLRVGLEVTWDGPTGAIDGPIQEFDVVFTDGQRLFIVECKAGAVTGDQVLKLQQCVRSYGGIDARGIMACAFEPRSPLTRKRVENANNISGFYGWDIANHLPNHISSKPS
ncbi:MAG: hypothetical protein JWL59_4340 [Chthoniobacteraceae bacterium]|nr:hypothetical protein [Chthoniobacteraceae bacterium]